MNWTRHLVAGEWKRYDYPRSQFTNVSTGIRELCCWALDLVDIPWCQSNWKTISVSTRGGVARLDEFDRAEVLISCGGTPARPR